MAKICLKLCIILWGLPSGSVVKSQPASVGDAGDRGSIPGSGRSLGEGNGNPLQYSCLGNILDRGAWRATVYSKRVGHDRATEHTYIVSTFYFIAYFINKNSYYFIKILLYNKWCTNCFIIVLITQLCKNTIIHILHNIELSEACIFPLINTVFV